MNENRSNAVCEGSQNRCQIDLNVARPLIHHLNGSNMVDATPSFLILGNGKGQLKTVLPHQIVLTFNGTHEGCGFEHHVEVLNAAQSLSGEDGPWLRTSSKWLGSLASELKAGLNLICRSSHDELGTLPSTGFSVVHTLWRQYRSVSVVGMSFDPTLLRPRSLGHRTPLPQMFHNWLGERRASFGRWIRSPNRGWSWPLMDRPAAFASPGQAYDHRELLEAMEIAKTTGCMASLSELSRSPICPDDMLLRPASETLALEQCFYLERGKTETTNWWLYDADATEIIDRLAARLREAQRQAFARAMSQ